MSDDTTLLGVAQPGGPRLTRTQIRACDRDTGKTELLDGVTCLTCGWQIALPDAPPEERALFGVADYEHTTAECAARLERQQSGGWWL